MGDILITAINKFLYNLTYIICKLIDLIVDMFKKLAGIEPISTKTGEEDEILGTLIKNDAVSQAFWIILGLAVVLLIVVTIVSVIKTYGKENPQAELKEVMTGCFKAISGFLLINAIMMVAIMVVPIIFNAINNATSQSIGGEIETTLGGSFIAGGTGESYAPETATGYIKEILSGKYAKGDAGYAGINFSEFNNFLVILVALPTLISFFYLITLFVKRLFALLGLYISAPVVLATEPSDGGFAVKKWRESLFNQFFNVLGVIVLLNIYLLLCPIMDGWEIADGKWNSVVLSLIKGAGAVGICAGAAFVEKLFSKDGGEVKATGKSRLSGILGGGKNGKDGKDADGKNEKGSMLSRIKSPVKPAQTKQADPRLLAIMRGGGTVKSTPSTQRTKMLPSGSRNLTSLTNRKPMLSQRAVQTRSTTNFKKAENMKRIIQGKKSVERPKMLNVKKKE